MSNQSRPLERLAGRVERELARGGTASEHTAVVLHTDDGDKVILQRIGGNPFNDSETHALAGHNVHVEGYRLGDIFRYTSVKRRT